MTKYKLQVLAGSDKSDGRSTKRLSNLIYSISGPGKAGRKVPDSKHRDWNRIVNTDNKAMFNHTSKLLINGENKMVQSKNNFGLSHFMGLLLLTLVCVGNVFASDFKPSVDQEKNNILVCRMIRDINAKTNDGELLPDSLKPSLAEMYRVLKEGPVGAIDIKKIDGQTHVDIKGKNLRNAFINLMQFATVEAAGNSGKSSSRDSSLNEQQRTSNSSAIKPITIALAPVGPMMTGKGVLLNLAAMMSIYLGTNDLQHLQNWFEKSYKKNTIGSNPFSRENDDGEENLDSKISSKLSRFFTEESIAESIRNITDNTLLMPTVDEAKIRFSEQAGTEGFSDVVSLYHSARSDRDWDLINANRGGWKVHQDHTLETAVDRLTYVKDVIDSYKESNDTKGYGKANFGKHILLQIRANSLTVGLNSWEVTSLIDTIKYIKSNSKLDILLAVSFASELNQELNSADQIHKWLENQGAAIASNNIFFFEFGGLMDLKLGQKNQDFRQALVKFGVFPDEDTADLELNEAGNQEISEWLNRMIEENPEILTKASRFLRYRMAKNFGMIHNLFKRIHDIESNTENAGQEWETLTENALKNHSDMIKTESDATKFSIDEKKRTLFDLGDGYNDRAIDGLDSKKIHFIRLCNGGQCAKEDSKVFSFDLSLKHEAIYNGRPLEKDYKFDQDDDITPQDREAKLWRPFGEMRRDWPHGAVVEKYGEYITSRTSGWFGQKETSVVKESVFRNFLHDPIKDHNFIEKQFKEALDVNLPQHIEGQTGWLVLNADLWKSEIEEKEVVKRQREKQPDGRDGLDGLRKANVKKLIRIVTGTNCEDKQIDSVGYSLILPERGYKESSKENDCVSKFWIYPVDVDTKSFKEHLHTAIVD